MRLLLDANLSPKQIGGPLAVAGHEVISLAADPVLGALDDPEVLELVAEQQRILITRNSRDFAPLLRQCAEATRHHPGCILLWTLGHHEFGAILEGVNRLLAERSAPAQWQDLLSAGVPLGHDVLAMPVGALWA